MGTRYIVLNSSKTAKDLLEKQSAITANRPHYTMGGDLVGWNDSTVFLQYDSESEALPNVQQNLRQDASVKIRSWGIVEGDRQFTTRRGVEGMEAQVGIER
jgi:hypothetical protein